MVSKNSGLSEARQRSLANLRPWKKGQSGNPNGRPKTPEELKAQIASLTAEMVSRIAELARSAKKESVRLEAARYLTDRHLGKPTERQQVEQVPVTYVAPTDAQFSELAERWMKRDSRSGAS